MSKSNTGDVLVSVLENHFFEDEANGLQMWEGEISKSLLTGDRRRTGTLCKFLYEYIDFFGEDPELKDIFEAYSTLKGFYGREWGGIHSQLDSIRGGSSKKPEDLAKFVLGLLHLYKGELKDAIQTLEGSIKKPETLGVLWWQASIEYCEALRMSGQLLSAKNSIDNLNSDQIPSILKDDYLLTKGLILSSVGELQQAEEIYQSLYSITKKQGDFYRYFRTCYYHSETLRLSKCYKEALIVSREAVNGLIESDLYRAALAMRYLSCAEVLHGNIEESLNTISEALKVFNEVGANTSIAIAEKIKGIVYYSLGDSQKCIQSLDRASKLLSSSQCEYEYFKVKVLNSIVTSDGAEYERILAGNTDHEFSSVWRNQTKNINILSSNSQTDLLNIAM